jgi:hypothetical protein
MFDDASLALEEIAPEDKNRNDNALIESNLACYASVTGCFEELLGMRSFLIKTFYEVNRCDSQEHNTRLLESDRSGSA